MNKNEKVFSWQEFIVMAVVIIVGIYALLPEQQAVIERLIDSGESARALEKIEKISASERARDPVYFSAIELQLQRELRIQDRVKTGWASLFKQGWENYQTLNIPSSIETELLKIIPYIPRDELNAVLDDVQSTAPKLPLAAVRPIAEKLVIHSLAQEAPALAVTLYETVFLRDPTRLSSEVLMRLLELQLLADQPEAALTAIDRYTQDIILPADDRAAIESLEITLLQRMNRVSDAFDRILKQVKHHPELAYDNAFFTLAETLALQSDRATEILPIMEARLERFPTDEALHKRYLNLVMATQQLDKAVATLERRVESGHANDSDRRQLAQIYEWTGHPANAFPLYQALALGGDTYALDRMIALNPSLFKHYELAAVLEQLPWEQKTPDVQLFQARLLAEIGDYENAAKVYQRHLESPKHRSSELYIELADVQKTRYAFSEAIAAYRNALAHDPGAELRTRIRMDIAWMYSLAGDYDASLAEYQKVYEESPQDDALKGLLSVAFLLEKKDLYFSTIETLLARNPNYKSISDEEAAAKMHRTATFGAAEKWQTQLDQYTRDLATHHAQQKEFTDAIRVIERHSQLFKDATVFNFYLTLFTQQQSFTQAARILDSPEVLPEVLNHRQVLETAIWVYEASGQVQRAMTIAQSLYENAPESMDYRFNYARLLAYHGSPEKARELLEPLLQDPQSADIYRLIADVSLATRDYKNAEYYYLLYLQAQPTPSGESLAFLGDIRLSRGDTRGARQAYTLALKQSLRAYSSLDLIRN